MDAQMRYLFYGATLGFLLIFLGLWFTEKRRLLNGIFFNLFFFSGVISLAIWDLNTQNIIFMTITGGLVAIVLIAIGLFFTFNFVFLIWNGWIVWRKESHNLANLLTLLLGLGLIALFIIQNLADRFLPDPVYQFIFGSIFAVALYLIFWFYNYLTVLVLYQFNRPRLRQNFIIVLGAGLLDGETVSPLLANRIDRAIAFYQKQLSKNRPAPKLIFSGGQGADEKISEALAMQRYAIAQGIPIADTLLENRSVSTWQNMKFSQEIILDSGVKKPRTIFVTNNYHTFRAGLFAKQVGLKANGIGAKTSRYFLPNAIIREYVAIFLSQKKWHFIIIALILLLNLSLAIIGALNQ